MIDLRILIDRHPGCLSSRATLRSYLLDMFPNERKSVNILVSIFECGIAKKIHAMSFLTTSDIQNFVNQLEREYGISPAYAEKGVRIWAEAFRVKSVTSNTKIKRPMADGVTFNVTDNEFIEWINRETKDFQVEQKQYAEAKGSTAHVVTMSNGDRGYLYFHHDTSKENYEAENLDMVSAIAAVGFTDKSTALALVACIGSYIDRGNRDFRLIDAVHHLVNTGSYTRANMTAIRVQDRYVILAAESSRYAMRK